MRSVFFIISLITSLSLYCTTSGAEEAFYLTHVEKAFSTDYKGRPLPTSQPAIETFSTSINATREKISLKDGKVFFNDEQCNLQIDKMTPFSIDNFLVDMIDATGGDGKFNEFLKTKLHTNMAQWKKEYTFKANGRVSEYSGCKLLQNGITYRSPNELIITDTDFFYRFITKVEVRVQDISKVSGYIEPVNNGKSCIRLSKKYFSDKNDFCLYTDDIDAAQRINAKYKCFKKNSTTKKTDELHIYDTKKKCDDDYNFFLEFEEYQG